MITPSGIKLVRRGSVVPASQGEAKKNKTNTSDEIKKTKAIRHCRYPLIYCLPESRLGKNDKICRPEMAIIATEQLRDRFDRVICQVKLDGSNVSVALLDGKLIAMNRLGFPAETSPYEQHHRFAEFVQRNESRFRKIIGEGERLCGEWLLQAHGTRYRLRHEPFVAFDVIGQRGRLTYPEFNRRIDGIFPTPAILSFGPSIHPDEAMKRLARRAHGELDEPEGLIYRVERNELFSRKSNRRRWRVEFLVKFLRHGKEDGKYLPGIGGGGIVWNEQVRR